MYLAFLSVGKLCKWERLNNENFLVSFLVYFARHINIFFTDNTFNGIVSLKIQKKNM